jgi:hypothetical protein
LCLGTLCDAAWFLPDCLQYFFLAKGVFLFVYSFKKGQAKALLCMDARRAGQQSSGPRHYFFNSLKGIQNG